MPAANDSDYTLRVTHKPAAPDDPIPWLATIYHGDTAIESYWRGTEDEAHAVLPEWLAKTAPLLGKTVRPMDND